MAEDQQLKIRLPADVKHFIAVEATKNRSSQSSEVVRALRERMERENKTAPESAGTLARA